VKFLHGGLFCHAALEGALAPTRCVQIGICGASEYPWELSRDSGMTVIHEEAGAAPWCSRHYRDYQAFGGGWFGLCHVWSVLLEAGPQNHNILLGIMVSFLHFC
jgi:hypothetical protein